MATIPLAKRVTAVVLVAAGLGGCVQQAPVFSWYHPLGGEYLFAYDSEACESQMSARGQSLGTATDGPFFQCMHERGYYLVDANGIVQAPAQPLPVAQQQISSQ